MSFVNGFEKVAAAGGLSQVANKILSTSPARALGMAGKGIQTGAKSVRKSMKAVAVGERSARLEGFRGKSKPAVGGVASGKAIEKLKATNPNMKPEDLAKQTKTIQAGNREKALTRLDTSKKKTDTEKPGFVKKHPYLTAAAVYGGARMMAGKDESQPQPPPQIVQY